MINDKIAKNVRELKHLEQINVSIRTEIIWDKIAELRATLLDRKTNGSDKLAKNRQMECQFNEFHSYDY